jgi:mono/diheme cytochrome c family protein
MSRQEAEWRRRTTGGLTACIAWAWVSAFVSVAQTQPPIVSPQAAAGKKLFAQSCAMCHEVENRNQLVGPGLKSYYAWHHPSPNDAAVRELIIRGKGTMPGFSTLSDAELADLMAYLKTL